MIRATILLGLLVATPAEAATVGEWITGRICRVDPHHARCPPTPPAAPVQAPAVAPPPVLAPAAPAPQVTPQAAPAAVPAAVPPRAAGPPKRAKKAVKAAKPVKKLVRPPKSKFKAAPKRARSGGVVRWWCGYAPKWASPDQIVTGAKTRGYTVSRADAQACLASKT